VPYSTVPWWGALAGHCFMIEEGGETGNTFINNFGLRTRAVTEKIAEDETDDSPATFW